MTKVRDRRRTSRVTVEELLDEMHRSVDGLGEDGTSRRSPICPGSFSGSTVAAMAGFAS